MKHSSSFDFFQSKPHSSLVNYRGNISSLAQSINLESFKSLENMNKLLSRSGINQKLESIKKSMKNPLQKIHFEDILSNLDDINEVRFMKERLELSEKTAEKGFIEKDQSQYFEIKTKSLNSPIQIVLRVLKGSLEAFVSFTNALPNKDWHDKKFRGPTLDLHSKSSQFSEHKCYIGVHAKSNCSIEVSFQSHKLEAKSLSRGQRLISKSLDFSKDIQNLRESSELKQNFELKVREIKTKRKVNQRLDFISMNRTQACLSVNLNSSSQPSKLSQKIEDVRRRKVLITEEKTKRLRQNLMRREMKRQAEDQANEVHEMMLKKEKLQKKWLTLTFFAGIFNNWVHQLRLLRQEKIAGQVKRMKAYMIQKSFKRKFPEKFNFSHRILALGRNNLALFGSLTIKTASREFFLIFQKCVKEIQTYQQIVKSFELLPARWSVIKARLKFFMHKTHRVESQLMTLLNKAAKSLISRLRVKGKKKRKSHEIEKIESIPLHVKEIIIKKHMNEVKQNFIHELRSGSRPTVLNFLLDEEDLAKKIVEYLGSKPKVKKKLTIRG